jgi:putative endonuclease
MLTFVEVKTRTSVGRGRPAEAVTPDKERLVLRGAQSWLKMLDNPHLIPTRCDIVEVVLRDGAKPELSILEGAFKVFR